MTTLRASLKSAKRTKGTGTSVPSIKVEFPKPQEVLSYIATPAEIDQMLSKYDPKKLRPPVRKEGQGA